MRLIADTAAHARAMTPAAILLFAALLCGLSAPASAADASALHVTGAWARPSIGNLDRSAAYFEIMNHGTSPDRLLAVKTGVSAKAELHTTIMENDVVRMRPLDEGIEVPPGGGVKFEPAGNHVMLLGLKQPLKEGSSFSMTLVFEKAGEVKVDVAVRKSAASGGGHGAHQHHKH